jgi:hypothetical protein
MLRLVPKKSRALSGPIQNHGHHGLRLAHQNSTSNFNYTTQLPTLRQGWRLIKWAWNDVPGHLSRLVLLYNVQRSTRALEPLSQTTEPRYLTIVTNYTGSIDRLYNFDPHLTQSVSTIFRNATDQLLRLFSRLKITICAPALRDLPERLAPTPPPPNFEDTASTDIVRTMSGKAKDHSMGGPLACIRAHLTRVPQGTTAPA